MSEIELTINSVDAFELFGEKDAKLNLLRQAYPNVSITSRGEKLKLTGNKKEVQAVKAKIELMVRSLKKHQTISIQDVQDIVKGND